MLVELEAKLEQLSHSEAAIQEIRAFAENLGSSSRRLEVFNADRGLVQAPIWPDAAKAIGFDQPDDEFTLLQGDIVTTEAAYFLGERVTGRPKYVVLNSSCDLVPGRREYAALLRIREVRSTVPDFKSMLSHLLKFKKTDSMYLPPLPVDRDEVMGNAIQFDGVCQIRSNDLLLANRIASLTLVGWRIFASLSRVVIARTSERECSLRAAIERIPLPVDCRSAGGAGTAPA